MLKFSLSLPKWSLRRLLSSTQSTRRKSTYAHYLILLTPHWHYEKPQTAFSARRTNKEQLPHSRKRQHEMTVATKKAENWTDCWVCNTGQIESKGHHQRNPALRNIENFTQTSWKKRSRRLHEQVKAKICVHTKDSMRTENNNKTSREKTQLNWIKSTDMTKRFAYTQPFCTPCSQT